MRGSYWHLFVLLAFVVACTAEETQTNVAGDSLDSDTVQTGDILDARGNDVEEDAALEDVSADLGAPTVDFGTVQPVLRLYCAPCHTTFASGGTNFAEVYEELFEPSADCPGKNVGECIPVLISTGSMPKGEGCTGDFAADAGNAKCVTESVYDLIVSWIELGMPE